MGYKKKQVRVNSSSNTATIDISLPEDHSSALIVFLKKGAGETRVIEKVEEVWKNNDGTEVVNELSVDGSVSHGVTGVVKHYTGYFSPNIRVTLEDGAPLDPDAPSADTEIEIVAYG